MAWQRSAVARRSSFVARETRLFCAFGPMDKSESHAPAGKNWERKIQEFVGVDDRRRDYIGWIAFCFSEFEAWPWGSSWSAAFGVGGVCFANADLSFPGALCRVFRHDWRHFSGGCDVSALRGRDVAAVYRVGAVRSPQLAADDYFVDPPRVGQGARSPGRPRHCFGRVTRIELGLDSRDRKFIEYPVGRRVATGVERLGRRVPGGGRVLPQCRDKFDPRRARVFLVPREIGRA